jgi:uncharacterized protein YciI
MHFLLFYEGSDDYVTARAPFRKVHLQHAMAAVARGELVLGGAYANPANGAMLLFTGDSPQAAEDFARTDPYVINGVVKSWRIREWTTVVGAQAAVSIDPNKL